ncbi:WhiB family transcriptional regulator [Streptomyces scabiei]|uniref:WhiB family transcriptional regulator n=1 Tax=Streptomyces scabiei TaxID=1930 RepID=UPI0007658566|nr:WhiB family transcriptional regulator [Streptomyces scabiei]
MPTAAAWHERAACAGQDTNRWFPSQPIDSPAVSICRGCPARAECLYDALQYETPGSPRYGIRGGLTTGQRRKLPPLEGSKAVTIAALRLLLDEIDTQGGPEAARHWRLDLDPLTERTLPVTTAPARAALAGLRQRHTADQELTAITTEAEQLEKRLAELRAREAELVPTKPKKRGAYVRDYDTRTVRAWAEQNGVECSPVGQIPKRVLDAWRASTAA